MSTIVLALFVTALSLCHTSLLAELCKNITEITNPGQIIPVMEGFKLVYI